MTDPVVSLQYLGGKLVQNTAVKITDITKAFGANNVLSGINLELNSGQVTVLMGANGAGKSTLG